MKHKLKTKWKIIIIILLFISIFFICARFIGTKGLKVREYKVINSALPASFYGMKIVHFTDLHYGMSVGENEVSVLIEKINLTKPDIVIFTGDLIDRNTIYTKEIENILIKYLSKIKSTYGNYYVTGNHDIVNKSFDSLMNKCNFKSLNNTYEVITSENNDSMFIGGINSVNKDYSYLKELIKTMYNYKIIIMHYPDNIDEISNYNFDLALAGHSHNGQVRLPLIGAIITPHDAKKYFDEYYKINNTDFFISGGIGNSVINLRLFDKPSFNLYRLVDK